MTEIDVEVNVDELMRPFAGSQIRQRVGPGRRPLDYISGPDVIRRLLDATGNHFAWNVERVQFVTQEAANVPVGIWIVQGTLTVGNLGSRSGVGTHPADSVESAKAAETDALKRAALKFGVGLHLQEEDGNGQGNSPAPPSAKPQTSAPTSAQRTTTYQQRPASPQASQTRPASANNGNGNNGNGYAGVRRGSNTTGNSSGNHSSLDGVGENAPF